eukprot:NODE_3295_length_949_cov_13.472222_g2741_i0.p1 GENE.NODE_3295_length_949_cov_13.472222_g2741_i0~~NODE_3295_length_949_cov_13.472222_g2741_i0.p1  ORF type:complete len:170 (+),score=23.50 NODE_3295_length_949_cov_13.472222_g2741_i0:217-726(+)
MLVVSSSVHDGSFTLWVTDRIGWVAVFESSLSPLFISMSLPAVLASVLPLSLYFSLLLLVMGIPHVKPEAAGTHAYDGTPKALKLHPDPWQEYKRHYRAQYTHINRGQKLFFCWAATMSVMYFFLYAQDNYILYKRLKANIEDYKEKRTMYLDLPNGYLDKLEREAHRK